MRRLLTTTAAVAVLGTALPSSATPQRMSTAPVIAVVGESGMNVLHHDFRTADGSTPAYPASLGRVVVVPLPETGTFAQKRAAVAAGPLGHLVPGQLYGIKGTRLLVVSAPGVAPRTDVTGGGTTSVTVGAPDDPTLHGTGVMDAAVGTAYGTAPTALGLLVLGSIDDAFAWVAGAPGVDVASTSTYQVGGRCTAAAAVRRIVAGGRPVFSSSGNTTDQGETLTSPNGLPEVYQVGGVTAEGAPYGSSPSAGDGDPFYGAGQVTRPYQTGELYDFRTAAFDSETGSMRFGGTSGATPRTAGWAADLIAHARAQSRRAARGPMVDGRLSGAELVAVMRHVAEPSMAGQAGAFYAEGYGALNSRAVRRAMRVLDGTMAEPARPQEDADQAAVERARAAAFVGC